MTKPNRGTSAADRPAGAAPDADQKKSAIYEIAAGLFQSAGFGIAAVGVMLVFMAITRNRRRQPRIPEGRGDRADRLHLARRGRRRRHLRPEHVPALTGNRWPDTASAHPGRCRAPVRSWGLAGETTHRGGPPL